MVKVAFNQPGNGEHVLLICTNTLQAMVYQLLAIFADSWLASHESVLLDCCLSSVTFVDCGQTVQDRPMVTMRHYWEVDIGLSESAKN